MSVAVSPVDSSTFGSHVRRGVFRIVARGVMLAYATAFALARVVGRRRPAVAPSRLRVLLTGSFHSNNWVNSHLVPLARSDRVAVVRLVTTFPVAPVAGVEVVVPPAWLVKVVGQTGARLLTFVREGWVGRPDVVGGFHLLFNGLLASIVARLAGARSLHLCVGGPAEVLGGGVHSENRLFERIEVADPVVEARLLRAVGNFDLVVTMGTRARTFFRECGVKSEIRVISGGLDTGRYAPDPKMAAGAPRSDVVFVGRLVPIKRIDLLLRAMRLVLDARPGTTLTIVGDGRLAEELAELAAELGIAGQVRFAGQQSRVEGFLQNARVFVLPSDSEGLSLALIEAMLCGLPAVVSDVGDLGDLVTDGKNGFLVTSREPAAFATRILRLLQNEDERRAFATAARAAANRFEMQACAHQWNDAFDAVLPAR